LDGEVREVEEAQKLGDEDRGVLKTSQQHLEVAEDGHMGFDGKVAEKRPEEDLRGPPDGIEGLVGEDAEGEGADGAALEGGGDGDEDEEEEEGVGIDPPRSHAPVDQPAEGFIDEVGEHGPDDDEEEGRMQAEPLGEFCCGEGEPQVGEEEHCVRGRSLVVVNFCCYIPNGRRGGGTRKD